MFGPLFDLSFWFALQPSALSPSFEKFFFFFFTLMILVGAVARIVARYKKDDRFLKMTYRKVAMMFLTMGIVGMSWFFFTYEMAYLLGARFWFLVWAIGLVVWIVSIVRFSKIHVPAEKAALANKATGNKYLPRKKRR
jgi:hypothetical protein